MGSVARFKGADSERFRVFPKASGYAIEVGDMLYWDGTQVKPANQQADQGSEAANQALFVGKFAGVSMQAAASAYVGNVVVATRGQFEFDCASATFDIGDNVAPDETAGITLMNQTVAKVTGGGMGRVAKRYGSATTSVLIDVVSAYDAQGLLYASLPALTADGLGYMSVARATYDFAEHGGAISAIGLGVTIPDNAIILGGYAEIIAAFVSTGGTGTIALHAQGANDLITAVDADTLSGIVAMIPDFATVADMIKLTAARELTLTIATAVMTAGKAVFFVFYVVSD